MSTDGLTTFCEGCETPCPRAPLSALTGQRLCPTCQYQAGQDRLATALKEIP